MATLSAEQLLDIRADVGDDGTVFTDAELHRLYTRASSNYNKAVVLALRQILANAVKLHDYAIAQSSESLDQIFKHLKEMLTYWESVSGASAQFKIVGMRSVPPRDKDEPEDWDS